MKFKQSKAKEKPYQIKLKIWKKRRNAWDVAVVVV